MRSHKSLLLVVTLASAFNFASNASTNDIQSAISSWLKETKNTPIYDEIVIYPDELDETKIKTIHHVTIDGPYQDAIKAYQDAVKYAQAGEKENKIVIALELGDTYRHEWCVQNLEKTNHKDRIELLSTSIKMLAVWTEATRAFETIQSADNGSGYMQLRNDMSEYKGEANEVIALGKRTIKSM